MTSDWGNKVFVEAGKRVVSGIFVGCKDSESDKGDRIESLFNIFPFGLKKERLTGSGLVWTRPEGRRQQIHWQWQWSGCASRSPKGT